MRFLHFDLSPFLNLKITTTKNNNKKTKNKTKKKKKKKQQQTQDTFHIFFKSKHFILVRLELTFLQTYFGDNDQTPLTVASALGLHCLPT